MLFYIIISLILLLFVFLPQKVDKLTYSLSVFFIFILGAFRDKSVGTDTKGIYWGNFKLTTLDPGTWSHYTPFEPGYNVFIGLLKEYVCPSYELFYGLSFAIFFICFVVFLNKTSVRPLVALFFFIAVGYLGFSFNAMRQCVALGLACLSIVYLLENGKNVKYLIVIMLISILFHKSFMLMMILPIFRFEWIKSFLTKKILYIIILVCYVAFLFHEHFVNIFYLIIPYLHERYATYLSGALYVYGRIEVSPKMVTIDTLVCVLCIFLARKKDFSIYFWIYIIGVLMQLLLLPLSYIFHRLITVWMLFGIVIYSNLWDTDIKYKVYFRTVLIIYAFGRFYIALSRNYNEIIPYSNWLFN